jgi:hypothetical protein
LVGLSISLANCPLCEYRDAFVSTEDAGLVVSCELCGGTFTVSYSAAGWWSGLTLAARSLALPRLRGHLASAIPSVDIPEIQLRDVITWSEPPD